jgi:hypothetical protein
MKNYLPISKASCYFTFSKILSLFFILHFSFFITYSQDSIDGHLMTEAEKKQFCESATLWRGFYHQWNYNHRTNRLGDYIVQDNAACNYATNIIHTGASGIGRDNLEFTSFYTQVKTTSARFFMDVIEFKVKGDEGEIVKKSVKVTNNLSKELTGLSNYYVLLNGFDLYSDSTKGSDKMFKLKISPENLIIDPLTGEYSFDIFVEFGADCNTIECNLRPKNQFFSYNFTIAYVIVGGNNGLNVVSDSISNYYTWNRVSEIYKEDHGIKSSAIAASNVNQYYPFAILAVKHFDLLVQTGPRIKDEATHMLTLDLSLHPEGYEPKNNTYYYRTSLFFKPWRKKMRMWATRSNGIADFKLGVYMLQFADEDASIRHLEYSDRYRWKTNVLKHTPSTNPNAVKKYSITYIPPTPNNSEGQE